MKEFDYSEEPIIGKYYFVKCAKLDYYGKEIFIPIIGELHIDNCFDFPFSHYHIDGRFTNHLVNSEGKTNRVFSFDEDGYSHGII